MSKYGFSFSWKRALGISAAKQRFARQTGIPTTQSGLERKVGRGIISLLLSLFTGKRWKNLSFKIQSSTIDSLHWFYDWQLKLLSMHHFKYNIIKKEILAKRQDYFKELTEQKLNLDQFTNKSLNEVALMQKLKEANEILDELMVDNWSEYNKQESQEWIDIQIASDTNRTLYNSLLFKRKHNKNNIDTINERIIKLGKLVEFGDWLYGKLDKMEDALSIVELKKDYRPILESNTINKIVTSRGAIIVKCINSCFTNGMLHPNRFKNVSTHFEYLENDHELCFQNEVKVKVDNDFFKKIEFICDYLDFNDIEKNKELDDCYFPISYEIPNNFDTRTDVGLNGDSFDFHLSIINHEIHESYSGDILNCTFRLRLLIDFILSYKI